MTHIFQDGVGGAQWEIKHKHLSNYSGMPQQGYSQL